MIFAVLCRCAGLQTRLFRDNALCPPPPSNGSLDSSSSLLDFHISYHAATQASASMTQSSTWYTVLMTTPAERSTGISLPRTHNCYSSLSAKLLIPPLQFNCRMPENHLPRVFVAQPLHCMFPPPSPSLPFLSTVASSSHLHDLTKNPAPRMTVPLNEMIVCAEFILWEHVILAATAAHRQSERALDGSEGTAWRAGGARAIPADLPLCSVCCRTSIEGRGAHSRVSTSFRPRQYQLIISYGYV